MEDSPSSYQDFNLEGGRPVWAYGNTAQRLFAVRTGDNNQTLRLRCLTGHDTKGQKWNFATFVGPGRTIPQKAGKGQFDHLLNGWN
jgi:hypothetical protein